MKSCQLLYFTYSKCLKCLNKSKNWEYNCPSSSLHNRSQNEQVLWFNILMQTLAVFQSIDQMPWYLFGQAHSPTVRYFTSLPAMAEEFGKHIDVVKSWILTNDILNNKSSFNFQHLFCLILMATCKQIKTHWLHMANYHNNLMLRTDKNMGYAPLISFGSW